MKIIGRRCMFLGAQLSFFGQGLLGSVPHREIHTVRKISPGGKEYGKEQSSVSFLAGEVSGARTLFWREAGGQIDYDD